MESGPNGGNGMKGAIDASTGMVDGKKVLVLKDPTKTEKDINMEAIHFSCQCDKINDTDNFGGVIIYSCGSYQGMDGGRYSQVSGKDRFRSGYVILKDASLIPKVTGEEGQIHGRIVNFLLGCQPSVIAAAGGAMAGFSYKAGELSFNSWSCNAPEALNSNVKSAFMEKDSKKMSDTEITIFEWAFKNWMKSGQAQQNHFVKDCPDVKQ